MDMDEPSNHNQEAFVDMVPDGDCILVVGPDTVKLRVHSLFLRTASKPFSAMFTPEWKEGEALLSQSGPIEILLPEDDATHMRLLCAIIHNKNEEVPANLSAHNVLGVAIAADKYDCVQAVKFASDNWLRGHHDETSDLVAFAAAAYLLWNENAFKEITKRMILTHNGPYYNLCSAEVGSVMDWRVFCRCFKKEYYVLLAKKRQGMLEEARGLTRLKLANILIKGADDPTGSCVHKCGWSSKYAFAYLQELEKRDLWPMDLARPSISSAIEKVSNMPDPVPKESSASCTYGYKHCMPEYRRHRQWGLENLDKNVGLCLRCIRNEGGEALHCQHMQ